MAKRKKKTAGEPAPVRDYRHSAKRKNNTPAGLAAQGRVSEVPRMRFEYDPHLPPRLLFDPTGKGDVHFWPFGKRVNGEDPDSNVIG